MTGMLIARVGDTQMAGQRQKSCMLARAVIVDPAWAFIPSDHIVGGFLMVGQMRSAGEVRLAAGDARKPGVYATGVHGLAGVGGAGKRQFLVADACGVGGAGLDHRQRLEGLEGRARIHRNTDRTHRLAQAAAGVANGDGAPVAALGYSGPNQLGQNGVGDVNVGLQPGPSIPRVRWRV